MVNCGFLCGVSKAQRRGKCFACVRPEILRPPDYTAVPCSCIRFIQERRQLIWGTGKNAKSLQDLAHISRFTRDDADIRLERKPSEYDPGFTASAILRPSQF